MKRDLFFNQGKFKILQFTDIHFSEDNELDHQTLRLMEQLIREETPDFIILTGDTVYGPKNDLHITKALEPILNSDIPWSITLGNHDTEEGVDDEALFEIISNLPNCMSCNADASIHGMGNHYNTVKNMHGETRWILFGIDSGNYNHLPEIGGYDYVKPDQINWFRNVIHDFEGEGKPFSALVFMHIPLQEYNEVWNTQTCYGEKREEVCCSGINSGFFANMLEAGHTKGVFVGHDHINDYMGSLHGITLGYGRATGYHTYGQEGYERGARIIVLEEDNTETFETYLRLADGRVIREPVKHEPKTIDFRV